MEVRHKDLITSHLGELVSLVDYKNLREHLLNLRVFPPSHLKRLDERSNPSLDMFIEAQRRGPTAFRRLLSCLKLAGEYEALKILSKGDDLYLDNSVYMEKAPLNLPTFTQTMDLTDSPIQPNQISVLQATVFHEENSMTYKMSSSPRGFALIVDNEEYDALPPRRGSHVDSQCLTQLFQQLGFWVVLKRNLGRASLEYELTAFATDNFHVNVDMAVVCLLSHGENGTIICRNGEKMTIESILGRFNNQAAPSLRGKPKYFLIQSCRGLDVDGGIEVDGPELNLGENIADLQGIPLNHFLPGMDVNLARNPSFEDMIVSYATIPGFVAYRNNVKGSWFVQSFCKVFMEYCHEEDLVTLLHRVSQQLKTYCTIKGEKQMCETLLRGVYRKIFFNPGLADSSRVLIDGRNLQFRAQAGSLGSLGTQNHIFGSQNASFGTQNMTEVLEGQRVSAQIIQQRISEPAFEQVWELAGRV